MFGSAVFRSLTVLLLGFLLIFPQFLLAQGALTLTVTPPLFQLSVNPGDTWKSAIKVANVNDFEITLFASVVNFEANNEGNGQGNFVPLLEQDRELYKTSLASWITITQEPIIIAAGETRQLPFEVIVPDNAGPGGHYAAILVGSQPIREGNAGNGVAVSSLVSSLIFARITGEIIEDGIIRSFTSDQEFYQTPQANFTVDFENRGNVHLLPQGDIIIYNMWGKERGRIPINQKTEFGNVLPESNRSYAYAWSGEHNPLDFGHYSAVATLSFGSEARQSVNAKTTFWVIPVVPVASVIGGLFLSGWLFLWFIRLYIRRAVTLQNERLAQLGYAPVDQKPKKRQTARTLAEPLVDGVMDLRSLPQQGQRTGRNITKKYRNFLFFVIFIVLLVLLVVIFFRAVLIPERSYDVDDLTADTNLLITE